MANACTICLCILVAVQAASCLPEPRMPPMLGTPLLEGGFATSPTNSHEDVSSDEADISRDSYDSLELVPAFLDSRDGTLDEWVEAPQAPHLRVRRQSGAMDLSLSHNDRNGLPRPVGRPHGYADLNVVGNNRNNYHANMGAGLGAVAWRSRDGLQSVGVGATVDHFRGRDQGYRYSSRPSYGVGVGYRRRF